MSSVGANACVELVVVCVVFERGTLRGRLPLCQHTSGMTIWKLLLSAIAITRYKTSGAQRGNQDDPCEYL